jgi:ElaB/YqjD/DUF883 family membrane-anchored ribosome-binding protein
MGHRIGELERRVQDDVESIQAEAKGRASMAVEEARGKMQGAKDSLRVEDLKSMVEQHTVSSMAGALGVGVLLGVVSESIGGGNGHSNGHSNNGSGSSNARQSAGGGGLGSVIASVFGPAASTAQNELQELVRDGFSIMKEQVHQVRDNVNNGSSANSSDTLVKNRDVGVE